MDVHLKAWREQRLLTQRELAEKAGVDQSTIVRVERSGKAPRFGTLRKLAKALEVAPQLLRREPREDEQLAVALAS